ncbi:MAG: Panacea domain-containing protein [Anaerolineaceae bacterium]
MKINRKYRKALEALVYLANKEKRNYWILKTIYFADKEHLSRYGRQIFDDGYRAMKQGPVPSLAYDIVKCVRGDGWFSFSDPDPKTALEVPDHKTVLPKRQPDLEFLSQSDIECLDHAYNLIKDLNFKQLKKLSHDEAYQSVGEDEEMTIESIISTLKNKDEILNYRQR